MLEQEQPLVPILMNAANAARYIGISETDFLAMGVRRKVVSPRIKLYHRPDLDAIKEREAKKAAPKPKRKTPKRSGNEINQYIRAFVMKRDGQKCKYCGDEAGPFHLDHVVPVRLGGSHESDNLVVACRSCNCSKGSKTVEEWKGASHDTDA